MKKFTTRDLKYYSFMFPALYFALETMQKQIFHKKTGIDNVGKIFERIATDTQKEIQAYLYNLANNRIIREGRCTFDVTTTKPMDILAGLLVLEIIISLDGKADLCRGLLYYNTKRHEISFEIN